MSVSRCLRRWSEQARSDRGVSLFELLVVMSIFVVIMALCFRVLETVQQQTGDNLSQAEAVGMARLGLANVDRQLRSAETIIPPSAAAPMSIRAYIAADNNARCVQFEVTSGGALRMRQWTTATSVGGWRTLATRLANSASAPPFEVPTGYGDKLVNVRLVIKPKTSSTRPVEITTSLTRRNSPATTPSTLCDPTTVP